MLITQRSSLTGNIHTLEIGVTQQQLDAWRNGELIQRAMPNLSPSDREFILNGSTQEEWDELMGEEE